MIIDHDIVEAMVEEGFLALSNLNISPTTKKIIYFSKSTSTDNRFFFLEQLQNKMSNTEIIAMIPKIAKDILEQKYHMNFICEPIAFSKSFFAFNDIEISSSIYDHVVHGELYDEYLNLAYYTGIKEDSAKLLVYFAEQFLRKLLNEIKPNLVLLWNEFCGIHGIIRKICDEMKIPVSYLEFGVLPGTYAIDILGQMGGSFPARYPNQFRKLEVTKKELERADDLREYFLATGVNRKIQPQRNLLESIRKRIDYNKPIILYAGQNDLDSGIYPYTDKTKKYHSPIFESSDSAAIYLAKLSEKNGWNFIYKPHPSMANYELKEKDLPLNVIFVDRIDINEIIDLSDLVITILSQTSYVSSIRKKPTLMLGYNQICGKGCVYEAYKTTDIENEINQALTNGYTYEQNLNFVQHIAQLVKYYLYDDLTSKPYLCGKDVELGAEYLNGRIEDLTLNPWINWTQEDDITIFGSGLRAENFIKKRYEYNRINLIVDNNVSNQGAVLYGLEVCSPKALIINRSKIVICSDAWRDISVQLTEMGYNAFDDFIPDWVLNISNRVEYGIPSITPAHLNFLRKKRKIIALMGNCQNSRIKKFLEDSQCLKRDYLLLNLPLIQNLSVWERIHGPKEHIFKEIDVFISQPISNDNRFSPKWSTDKLKEYLNESCKVIIIPNLFFKGYYPQAGHDRGYIKRAIKEDNGILSDFTFFPWGDKYIDNLCFEGLAPTEIVKRLMDTDFLSEEYVICNAESSLQELEKRENEYCTIRISDYIRENYKKFQLFYSERHPTDILTRELSKRILEELGYSDTLAFPKKDSFGKNALVIYPAVKKHLGLEFNKDYIYISKPYYQQALTIEEYIHAYISYIHQNQDVDEEIMALIIRLLEDIKSNEKLYIFGCTRYEYNFLNKYKKLIHHIDGFVCVEENSETEFMGKSIITLAELEKVESYYLGIINYKNNKIVRELKDKNVISPIKVYNLY